MNTFKFFLFKCAKYWSLSSYLVIDIYKFYVGWFGIRKDFCHFLLSLCPLLQEYGNISYQPRSAQDQPAEHIVFEKNAKKIDLSRPIEPIISIDMPDW